MSKTLSHKRLQSKINLIYIASNGFSGSTLLDVLLGAHPEIMTVGEIQLLPWEIKLGGVDPCGCGLPVPECPFWKAVLNELGFNELKGTPIEFFRESHWGGKILRWKLLTKLLFKKDNRLNQQILEYGYNNYLLFKAVLSAANRHLNKKPYWIVDASKDFYRMVYLKRSGYFNMKVIHLMKDPRNFVYTTIKGLLSRRSIGNYSPTILRKAIRMSGRWLVENWLIDFFCKKEFKPDEIIKIKYESLAGNPEKTLKYICNFLEIKYTKEILENFINYENHGISGSEIRYERKDIYLDEKWRYHLPGGYKLLTHVITFPLQKTFGY